MCYIVQLPDGSYYTLGGSVDDPCKATHFQDKGDAAAIAKAKGGKVLTVSFKADPPPKDTSRFWVMGLVLFCVVIFRDPNSLAALQRMTKLDEPSYRSTPALFNSSTPGPDCFWF
jgi:hypothetical protein